MVQLINELINELPTNNVTTFTLKALDYLVPGQWENWVDWNSAIASVTGKSSHADISNISNVAVELYKNPDNGYQRAVWLYQKIDDADVAMGAAAMADKVGDKIPLFGGLLKKLTPKADTTQTIDLVLKIAIEAIAYNKLSKGADDVNVTDFATALKNEYKGPSLIRLAGLVCFDGLIPLGPDFVDIVSDKLTGMGEGDISSNGTFQIISGILPGGSSGEKLGFVKESFSTIQTWMKDFVAQNDLTPAKVTSSLRTFVDISDDKLDYLAAFLDMSTNYFEHTGIQTVAREVIEDAHARLYG